VQRQHSTRSCAPLNLIACAPGDIQARGLDPVRLQNIPFDVFQFQAASPSPDMRCSKGRYLHRPEAASDPLGL